MAAFGYVFGYGSLVGTGVEAPGAGRAPARERGPDGFIADLPGFTRGWGVAMDNRRAVPGYKRYVDDAGDPPAVFVAFLDLAPASGSGARVNGVCRPVDTVTLRELDARERNYDRVEVSELIDCGAPVWTYLGSAAGRARLGEGIAGGCAVIHAGYLAAVTRGFRALGEAEWAACAPSLDPRGLPVRALHRRELGT